MMERYANKQNLVQLAKAVHDKYSPVATPTANGLMSAEDKVKVDNLGKTDDPTDAGPIVELTAKGWAEQDTTVGKNLLPTAKSKTVNGVTFMVNADGSVTVNGTATDTADYDLMSYKSSGHIEYMGTLTLSIGSMALPSGAYCAYADGAPNDVATGHVIRGSATVTQSESNVLKRVYVHIPSGTTVNNLTFYPQLELGSTATSYEPYSGGAPSPSPSYPQEIRRVTGHTIAGKTGRYVDVDVQGRNLLDAANPTVIRASTFEYVGDVLTVTADRANAWSSVAYDIPCHEGADYTIAYDSLTSTGYVIRQHYDASDAMIGSSVGTTSGTAFTTPSGCVKTRIIFYARGTNSGSAGDTASYGNIMFVRGGTQVPYEPYAHITIPIPLPSRGWVAALPDGTADTLTLDGAGGYVWELRTAEKVYDGSSDETWNVGGNYASTGGGYWYISNPEMHSASVSASNSMCDRLTLAPNGFPSTLDSVGNIGYGNSPLQLRIRPFEVSEQMTTEQLTTWLASHPITFLLPLATPTTERGYVDSMPTVPIHATLSTDLHDLTVRCCADEGAAEIASAWGKRYESRIAALEEIVSELVAGA